MRKKVELQSCGTIRVWSGWTNLMEGVSLIGPAMDRIRMGQAGCQCVREHRDLSSACMVCCHSPAFALEVIVVATYYLLVLVQKA